MMQEANHPSEMERLALPAVQPLSAAVNVKLHQEIVCSLQQQLKDTMKEMRALADEKDPEHVSAMVLWMGDAGAPNNGAPKRGRKPTTEFAGEVSFSLELPPACYDNNVDIDMYMRIMSEHIEEGYSVKDYAHRFTVLERLQNWTVQLRKRDDKIRGDFKFHHLPSQRRFRSTVEVIKFALYGATRNTSTKKGANVAEDDHTLHLTFKEEELGEPSQMRERSSPTRDMDMEMKMLMDVPWEEYCQKSEEMKWEWEHTSPCSKK